MSDDKPRCPHCGSQAITEMSNQQFCNQCGKPFDQVRPTDVIPRAARRRAESAENYPGWKRPE